MSAAGLHSTVELRFADGQTLSAWESVRTHEGFTDPLGSYEFVVAPPRGRRSEYRQALRKGRRVALYINGARQGVLLITTVQETLAACRFQVEAKSILDTPHEGCVDPRLSASLAADTRVSEIVLKALAPYGFTTIDADATALVSALTGKAIGGRGADVQVDELKARDFQSQPGEPAYAFCARIFSRLGVALRCNAAGELFLHRPDYAQRASYALYQGSANRAGDRVLAQPDASVRSTNEGQFSEYIVTGKASDRTGQTSTGQPDGGIIVAGATRPSSAAFQGLKLREIAAGRHTYSAPDAPFKPRYRLDKKARDAARAENTAALMQGLHASQAWQLRCTVGGLVAQTGAVWTIDTIVGACLEDLGIDEELWLLEVKRQVSRDAGETTSLTLIPKGALLLGEEGGGE